MKRKTYRPRCSIQTYNEKHLCGRVGRIHACYMIGSYTVESSGEFSSPVPTYEPAGTRERTISSKTERKDDCWLIFFHSLFGPWVVLGDCDLLCCSFGLMG
jgi:hypothetical protein